MIKKINRLGKLSVDRHKMKVIYPHGEYVYCTKQVYTLLASFIDSEDMFLSNDTIVGICGWHKNDFGLNEKRRTAISNLRKSLKMNDFGIVIKYVRIREGYQLVINE